MGTRCDIPHHTVSVCPGRCLSARDRLGQRGILGGLQAQFLREIATHSSLQEFYFGDDHLLRRRDYRVDVAGGFPAVHYVYDIVEADGTKLPSKRRAYRADAEGMATLGVQVERGAPSR
jgi:hypothetical protein